uniref:Uncharacterized protein n=1 Tax=Oncorhynchus mykiss TaxID=8022 RepID=A0A8C7UZE5_ONCMY
TGSILATNVKDATPEVHQICCKMKPHSGKKFDVFTVKTFKTQVVVETNFFTLLSNVSLSPMHHSSGPSPSLSYVGGDEFMHLRVHKTLPHAGGKLELHRVQTPKTHNDPIGFF